ELEKKELRDEDTPLPENKFQLWLSSQTVELLSSPSPFYTAIGRKKNISKSELWPQLALFFRFSSRNIERKV
ncbi:Uncharacterized protein APZ42_001024, partial [Daphnia magna]